MNQQVKLFQPALGEYIKWQRPNPDRFHNPGYTSIWKHYTVHVPKLSCAATNPSTKELAGVR